jgi:hypothetical protein
MTAVRTKPKAKQRPRRPVYLRCMRLVDPETGESVGAWIPLSKWDARALRDRKYTVGTEVRAEFKKPRNFKFLRLAHAMAAMVVEQIDSFAGLSNHDALKRLQSESGAACEVVEYDIPNVGKLTRNEPRSLAFDEMEEGEFSEVMQTIYRHIQRKYWPEIEPETIEEMVTMYEKDH